MFVMDSNVVFSFFIKDSFTREIVVNYDGKFLLSEFVFTELLKYESLILKKSGMSESDFDDLLLLLLSKCVVVSYSEIVPFIREAVSVVCDIDIDDIPFVACALACPGSIIWSNDKALKKIQEVKVCNTEEIVSLMHFE